MAHIQGEYPIIKVGSGAMVDYTIHCPDIAKEAKELIIRMESKI